MDDWSLGPFWDDLEATDVEAVPKDPGNVIIAEKSAYEATAFRGMELGGWRVDGHFVTDPKLETGNLKLDSLSLAGLKTLVRVGNK